MTYRIGQKVKYLNTPCEIVAYVNEYDLEDQLVQGERYVVSVKGWLISASEKELKPFRVYKLSRKHQ